MSALVQLVWSHRLIPEVRNRFVWEKAAAKSIFSFGKWIFILTAVAFLAMQAARLIAGKPRYAAFGQFFNTCLPL